MIIGDHLRAIREEKKLSQGEIEKRTGLLRCYISRVENGHTVPAVETWGSTGKDARMLERFRQLLSRTKEGDRKLLLFMAQKMARGKSAAHSSGD
jgi:transcriptional regulator with XRE-family HTH domain